MGRNIARGLSSLRDGRITTLTRADGLSSDCIWALHEDSEGVLWVGRNGLNRLDHGENHMFRDAPRPAYQDGQLHLGRRLWAALDWARLRHLLDLEATTR